eukprot:RCo049047
MASDCVFCKIVAQKLPCYKVFENAHALAFLNIGPISKGHTLVVPKTHYARLEEVPADILAGTSEAVAAVGKALPSVVGNPDYNVLVNNGVQAGQEVMHVHFHVIPRTAGDGLGFRWGATSLKPEDGKQLAEQLATAIAAAK